MQADFHYARGAIQAAFKCYVRSRDYCTSPRQVAPLGLGSGFGHAAPGACHKADSLLADCFRLLSVMLRGPHRHTRCWRLHGQRMAYADTHRSTANLRGKLIMSCKQQVAAGLREQVECAAADVLVSSA